MTITPDELKQIVKEAYQELIMVNIDAPIEMKYYTRYQTCGILQISLSTVDTCIKKGSITCSLIGNRVLYSQDDIDMALSKNRSN